MLKNKHLRHILGIGLSALMIASSVPAFTGHTSTVHASSDFNDNTKWKPINNQNGFDFGQINFSNGTFVMHTSNTTKRKKHKKFNKRVVTDKEAQDVDNAQVLKESAHIDSVKKMKKLEGKLKYWQYRAQAHPTGKTHKVEMREVHKIQNEMNSVSYGVAEDSYVLHNRYAKKALRIQSHVIKNDDKIINDPRASAKAKAAARKNKAQNEKTMAESKAAIKENDEWNRKFAAEERKVAAELNSPKTNTYIPESNGQQAAEGYGEGVLPWQVRQNPKWYGRGYIEGLERIGWSKRNAHIAWRLLSAGVRRHPNRSSFWISEDVYTGAPKLMSD